MMDASLDTPMEYEMHDPTWMGTAYVTDDPVSPSERGALDDFSSAADRYLLSTSGFPPTDTADLKLRIVDAEGNLNRELLRTAKADVEQLEDLTPAAKKVLEAKIDDLVAEHFDDSRFD